MIGTKALEYSIIGNDITVKFTAVTTSKIFKRTIDVRKEKGMNTKVLAIITAQTDISLYEIADRMGVSYKTVRRAVAVEAAISVFKGQHFHDKIGSMDNYYRLKLKDML